MKSIIRDSGTVKCVLSESEREFLTYIKQASLANPFSDERHDLDRKIAGASHELPGKRHVSKAVKAITLQMEKLKKEGRGNIKFYSGDDRDLVEYGFYFEFFYLYRKRFDRLIQEQIKAGDIPVRAPFIKGAFTFLEECGFTQESASRTVEVCYQIRRAYYFINKSLIGRSPSMKQFRLKLWNNVFTHNFDLYKRLLWNRMEDFSTLILGDTGTGKGTAAAAIGRSGYIPFNKKKMCFVESFTSSFVGLNLSRFPETLIESELFGHRKGAFTGAVDEYKGVFSRCSPHGSIFLDEIGEVSHPVQIKLLQILQDREFSPVGSHTKNRFQGRVIAATNRPVNELRSQGIFRDDFYYRLCSDVITVPPLWQRIEEDPRELDFLLELLVKRMVGETSDELTEMTREVIKTDLGPGYPWPGNVRELEQCIRRVILDRKYTGDTLITKTDATDRITDGIQTGEMSAHELVTSYCHMLYERFGTFEEVSRKTLLDRRTVKKYIEEWKEQNT